MRNYRTSTPNITVQFIGKCPRTFADKMYEVAGEKKDQIHIRGIDQFIVKDEIEAMYHQASLVGGNCAISTDRTLYEKGTDEVFRIYECRIADYLF